MAAVNGHSSTYGPTAGLDRHGGGYLTVRETADVLHMHFMSVYKMVQTGRLPAVKVGSRWKIDPETLRSWMGRQSQLQRSWLLVGSRESTARSLQALLGGGHRVLSIGFDHLRDALEEAPDAVLLDATVDSHAALAALEVCRRSAGGAYLALCVGELSVELLRAALAGGVVTLLDLPINSQHVEQLTSQLQSA